MKDADLPSWDEVAGEPTTYENTYREAGNTQVLMSMNVRPDLQGKGLPRKLIVALQQQAHEIGVTHLLGSFRPTEFGKWKAAVPDLHFADYVVMKNEQGLPLDGWIRNLTRNGMSARKVDDVAMTVVVDLAEFEHLQQDYHPKKWYQTAQNRWECGEVGSWRVNYETGVAVYTESNLWGELPLPIINSNDRYE